MICHQQSRLCSAFILTAITAFLILSFSCSSIRPPANTVLVSGKIVTIDEMIPEAEALAIRDSKIVAVGSNEDIQAFIGNETEIIDLEGNTAVPGFIEGHAHLMSIGKAKLRLALKDASSWDEIVEIVQVEVERSEPGEWILGRGWHQEKWSQTPSPSFDGLPYHQTLSAISPDNPVYLAHASGHACIANANAMALADITKASSDPEGGEIVRDALGNLIGVFRETADSVVYAAYKAYLDKRSPEQVEADDRELVQLAFEECLSNGITSFCDAGAKFEKIDFYRKLADEGNLALRLWVMVSSDENSELLEQNLSRYRIVDGTDNFLTVRAIKRVIDGALGSHGAWLLEPYADLPTSSGLNTASIEEMQRTAQIAVEHGFQLCTHAIGDRANRETLNIYEEAFKAHPDKTDLRWRIEHAQHLHPDDISRFADLGVIASMQGIHCTSDGPWVPKRLGEKRSQEGAYVWQKLMNTGAIITNGTDAPVEDIDPLANFFASITRKLPDNSQFYPDQRMTRIEALRSYTINNAFAAFQEDIKGSISVGKLADVTVLSKDILSIPEDEILETEIVYTIVGGKVMYQR